MASQLLTGRTLPQSRYRVQRTLSSCSTEALQTMQDKEEGLGRANTPMQTPAAAITPAKSSQLKPGRPKFKLFKPKTEWLTISRQQAAEVFSEGPLPSAVIPNRLYLGGELHATNAVVKAIGATLVVNATRGVANTTCTSAKLNNQIVPTLRVAISDSSKQSFRHMLCAGDESKEPRDVLVETAQRIHEHLSENDKHCVFVHCQAGISRSATLVLAYLMMYRQDHTPGLLSRAFAQVRAVRSIADPNMRFCMDLYGLERELLTPRAETLSDREEK